MIFTEQNHVLSHVLYFDLKGHFLVMSSAFSDCCSYAL